MIMLYKGNNLDKISFPLGGIGSGCIGLAGNGELVDWEIFNRPNKNDDSRYRHRHTHLAIRALDGNDNVLDARVIVGDRKSNYSGDGSGVSTATMNGFPHFVENTFIGEFPIAKLDFTDGKFPGQVCLKAFNPIIPLDSENSSIPCAFFEVEVENDTDIAIKYDVAFSVRNPFKSSKNKATKQRNGITMFDAENENNNLTVMTDNGDVSLVDYWYRGWRKNFFQEDLRGFWSDFSEGKTATSRNYTDCGTNDVCSVYARLCIKPRERKSVRFVLSWSIPESYNYWYPLKDENGNDVVWKNYYATVFEDSECSASYAVENWDMLYLKTKRFTDAIYRSSIDVSMKSAIGSALSVLKSPTVMRLEDGSLYGFEGVDPKSGSCEGICQHVWNYAYVCCYLFPDLEKGIRNNELKYGVLDTGETLFRLPLPFGRRELLYLYTFSDGTKQKLPCLDGQMGLVIKVYREWKLSGDNEWLKRNWDKVKRVLEFAWSEENICKWDANADGVLEGRQHHTLDVELFGPSAWLEGFYLAALKAATEMAEFLGDGNAAEKYKAIFDNGFKYTKEKLFNGNYFVQKVDLNDKAVADEFSASEIVWNDENKEISHQIGEGCLIDQLCGQWHSELCGIGNIFDKEQAKTAAINIYRNNFRTSMRDFVNPWRLFAFNDEGGTVMCSYPNDADKPKSPIPYCEEVMSGFEYAFAGVLILNGYVKEAETVVREVRKRYDGEKRNPWNDIECGSNYARSMAAFSFIPIISGFTADLPNKRIKFGPKVNIRPFNAPWYTATGWGVVEITDNRVCISVQDGYVKLKELVLELDGVAETVAIDGIEVDFTHKNQCLHFNEVAIFDKINVQFVNKV